MPCVILVASCYDYAKKQLRAIRGEVVLQVPPTV